MRGVEGVLSASIAWGLIEFAFTFEIRLLLDDFLGDGFLELVEVVDDGEVGVWVRVNEYFIGSSLRDWFMIVVAFCHCLFIHCVSS